MEILKLSYRSELKQDQLDDATSVCDIYNALKRVYDDERTIVARIVYSLKILGHRRYGWFAIRKLEQEPAPFSLASLPGSINHDEFFLYQSLATTCKVIPEEYIQDFVKYFAKQMRINHNTIKSPCEALTKMLDEANIDCSNYVDVIELAMIKCKVPDLVMKEYNDSCNRISKLSIIPSDLELEIRVLLAPSLVC